MGDVHPEQGNNRLRPWRSWLLAVVAVLGAGLALEAVAPAPLQAQSDSDAKWLLLPSVVATESDPKHPARSAARLLAEELRAHGRRALSMQVGLALF